MPAMSPVTSSPLITGFGLGKQAGSGRGASQPALETAPHNSDTPRQGAGNPARSSVLGMNRSCNCGRCSACALRAYAAQDPSLSPQTGSGGIQSEDGRPINGGAGASFPEQSENTEPKNKTPRENPFAPRGIDGEILSRAEQLQLASLRKRDSAVRAHERAHLTAAGPYAKSRANFHYRKGPDGRNYAVGGEVAIDASKEAAPDATIKKMHVVRSAALAPVDPSRQDRKIAAEAAVKIVEARQELQVIRAAEARDKREGQRDHRSGEALAGTAPVNTGPATRSAPSGEYRTLRLKV